MYGRDLIFLYNERFFAVGFDPLIHGSVSQIEVYQPDFLKFIAAEIRDIPSQTALNDLVDLRSFSLPFCWLSHSPLRKVEIHRGKKGNCLSDFPIDLTTFHSISIILIPIV